MQENEISRDRPAGLRRIPLSWVFFPLVLLYHELLLRAFDPASVFFDGALLPIALAAIGGGLLLSLLCGLLPWRKTVRWVSLCLTLLWSVFVCVQYCCKSYFKTYFALTFMVTMTGHVVSGFASTMLDIILSRLPFLLLEHGGKTEVTELLEKSGVHPKIRFTTWEDYAIMAMAERGLGVGILPELILQRIPYRIEIRPLAQPYYRQIGLAMKDRRRLSPAAQSFVSYLKPDAE